MPTKRNQWWSRKRIVKLARRSLQGANRSHRLGAAQCSEKQKMRKLLLATVASVISLAAANAVPGKDFTASQLLDMCKSGETWQETVCHTYVRATLDSVEAIALTNLKSPDSK